MTNQPNYKLIAQVLRNCADELDPPAAQDKTPDGKTPEQLFAAEASRLGFSSIFTQGAKQAIESAGLKLVRRGGR